MSDFPTDHENVTEFLLNTCELCQWLNFDAIAALRQCHELATRRGSLEYNDSEYIPLTTGSVAEFYIRPMLSCVGDVDIMFHRIATS